MMFSPDKQVDDDRVLIRYLLGLLPEEETGRLDELSIAGDDFACRLREVENDLVDAYASGELFGETLARFELSYLSSAGGRERVRFAEALLASEGRATSAPPGNAADGNAAAANGAVGNAVGGNAAAGNAAAGDALLGKATSNAAPANAAPANAAAAAALSANAAPANAAPRDAAPANAAAANALAAKPGSANPRNDSPQRSHLFALPRWSLNWGFAGAACLLIAAGGYLLLEHQALRSQLDQAQADRTALQQRERELRKQLDEQRPRDSLAQAGSRPDDNHGGARTGTASRAPKTVAFLLLAQTRGTGRVTPIAVPPGIDRAMLQLQLEFDDFPKYRAALKDPVTNQIVWRSQDLPAISLGASRAVSASLPASLLKPQNYALELTGIPANGPAELIGSYPFSVVIE
jgi:hypothetical protein